MSMPLDTMSLDSLLHGTASPDTLAPFVTHWNADALAAAIPRRPPPLRTVVLAPSANDAVLHRPRRSVSFAPPQTLPPRFRIG